MNIKGFFLSLHIRRSTSRRKLLLLLLITALVCVQMWKPLEFYILQSRSLLYRQNMTSFVYKVPFGNVSTLLTKPANNKNISDFPYKYVISEATYCSNRSDLYIINLVGTAPWEVKARNRIRRLWANETYRPLTGFSTLFIIGQTTDDQMMEEVKLESSKFRDIVLIDVVDSYRNLTLKTLVLLHWVESYCDNVTWVLKSDADVFVNPFRLSRYLKKTQVMNRKWKHTLVCKRRGPALPCRSDCPHAKWRVTYDEYPGKKYPAYCQGPGYVIPRCMVRALYNAANKTHPFKMEDVYYTGILPQKIKRGTIKQNIANRFPWRPTAWQNSFVHKDIMILELDRRLGRGASTLVWSNILKEQGLVLEVNNVTIDIETTEDSSGS